MLSLEDHETNSDDSLNSELERVLQRRELENNYSLEYYHENKASILTSSKEKNVEDLTDDEKKERKKLSVEKKKLLCF
uniref:Uncharacterized protein n=1 Tax=Rhabditophanes sp. KR3021 TaxID=114890 RepID=A0AC35U1D8_9BILA